MTHAQGVQQCNLTPAQYLAITDVNFEVAKKLQVDQDPAAAKEYLIIMQNLIREYCGNVQDTKRVSLSIE
jgi:hypothetical protein